MTQQNQNRDTHFGFQTVSPQEKTQRVNALFSGVANRYDLMNDLMSLGAHRLWKQIFIKIAGFSETDQIIDLAGGTGDLTLKIIRLIDPEKPIILADPNPQMLAQARKRLLNQGFLSKVRMEQTAAEAMPFSDNSAHKIIIGFGFRNFTNKNHALAECFRVLKPGGKLLILEFSKPTQKHFNAIYDLYSYNILPKLGKWIAQDESSYTYLVESIRKHPDQQTVLKLFEQTGFIETQYYNMSLGIVTVHSGIKP